MTRAAPHAALTQSKKIWLIHLLLGPPVGMWVTVVVLLWLGAVEPSRPLVEAVILGSQFTASPAVGVGYGLGVFPAFAAAQAVLALARRGHRWMRLPAGMAAGAAASAVEAAILLLPYRPNGDQILFIPFAVAGIGAATALVCALLTLPIRVRP